jgi:flagellar biosynthesis GTPase FlhF
MSEQSLRVRLGAVTVDVPVCWDAQTCDSVRDKYRASGGIVQLERMIREGTTHGTSKENRWFARAALRRLEASGRELEPQALELLRQFCAAAPAATTVRLQPLPATPLDVVRRVGATAVLQELGRLAQPQPQPPQALEAGAVDIVSQVLTARAQLGAQRRDRSAGASRSTKERARELEQREHGRSQEQRTHGRAHQDQRARELEQREQELEQRERELEQQRALEQREQELERQREQELERRKLELEQREQQLKQRERELDERGKA